MQETDHRASSTTSARPKSFGPTVDVLTPHYRKPRFLRGQLKSLRGQIQRGDSVIVAEDGEDQDTEDVVGEFRDLLPIQHVTHQDLGSRKCFTRNQALAESTAALILYLDQDIALAKGTIDRLRRQIRPGWFIGLRRVMLDEASSERVLQRADDGRSLDFQRLRIRSLMLRLEGSRYLMPLRPRGCRGEPQDWRGMASFGLLAFRRDLIDVNGWDNRFDEHYYAEDLDLFVRLEHHGVKPAYASRRCTAFHLFHEPSHHDLDNENYKVLSETINNGTIRAKTGLEETIKQLAASGRRELSPPNVKP